MRSAPPLPALFWIAPVLACVAQMGCRSARSGPELVSSEAVVLDLPMLRQDELYECGLVAIAALCQYYEREIPAEMRRELVDLARENEGLSGGELRDALESLGMEVFLFRGTLDRAATGLYGHVDNGRPPIVMISKGGDSHHYCLCLGYDESLGNVFLLDPRRGRISTPRAVFERDWDRSERFTLLAIPAAEAAAGPPIATDRHKERPKESVR